jgi:hypothetical protein
MGCSVRRATIAVVYAAAALRSATWLDFVSSPSISFYGGQMVLHSAVAGSVVFGLAFLTALLSLRYAVFVGLLGTLLTLPYFTLLFAAAAVWNEPLWRVMDHDYGYDAMAAMVFWLVAALYSLREGWKWGRSYLRRDFKPEIGKRG